MTGEQELIDDLVVLGRGAPDKIKDGRVTICVAGWSKRLGFVRIYPTRTSSPLRQWNRVSVRVERNPLDSRAESWKIRGSKSEWDQLDRKIEVLGQASSSEKQTLVRGIASPCVSTLNDARVSLGIIRPVELRGYLDKRGDVDHDVQLTLSGPPLEKTKKNYDFQPRLEYRCSNCAAVGSHDQQIVEWGCYEWFRKNPGREELVFDNLQLSNPEYEKYLFIGNQSAHRMSYLVITVLRWKKTPGQTTLPM